MTTSRAILDRAASEDGLLTAILEAAALIGWKAHHDRRSDLARQQGDPGFPDLVLARNGVVMFLELKSEAGRPTTDQHAWLAELPVESYAVRARVVRPSDLDALLKEMVKP